MPDNHTVHIRVDSMNRLYYCVDDDRVDYDHLKPLDMFQVIRIGDWHIQLYMVHNGASMDDVDEFLRVEHIVNKDIILSRSYSPLKDMDIFLSETVTGDPEVKVIFPKQPNPS